jgi:glyoxylase-like metal-dependent hydrolase (beta-lactamase superfamily II)
MRQLYIAVLTLLFGISAPAFAAMPEENPLPSFGPLLPKVTARAWKVDPKVGYAVREIKPNIYMITDGGYQSLFVTTGKGVVLFDAPPSFATHIVQAVRSETGEPIVMLVYSHSHVDHIGGAGLVLRQNPRIRIVASAGVAQFLREQEDPARPVPTSVFHGHEILTVGSMSAQLKVGYWHSPPGDSFIWFPKQKVLMAVDAMSAGSVPFMGLDLTQNMHEYLKVFDQLLAYPFDVLVAGHHSNPSTRADVELVRSYVTDLYVTVKRIVEADHGALIAGARQKYGAENTYAIARVLIDNEVDQCGEEMKSRWMTRLDDVDVWAQSQCRTALVYFEWDVGPTGHAPMGLE